MKKDWLIVGKRELGSSQNELASSKNEVGLSKNEVGLWVTWLT